MKGANSYMKVLLVVFRENFIHLKFHLGQFDRAWWKLSQATVNIGSLNSQDIISFMITTGSLNSEDMIRILKQSRHDFSGKHLCDGYCMCIMCCLCVEVKIQSRAILLCKASLRISSASLFECKGP